MVLDQRQILIYSYSLGNFSLYVELFYVVMHISHAMGICGILNIIFILLQKLSNKSTFSVQDILDCSSNIFINHLYIIPKIVCLKQDLNASCAG